MRGKGNGSLGQALFTLVKSIQSLHFPFALRTTTGLANHVGWSTPLTRPAASNFLISSAMNSWRSTACFLTFCLMGRARGQTASLCSITFLGTPGMLDGCQANTSTFARRKATSALSYLLSSVALMVKVPPVPSSLADTFLVAGGAAIPFLHLPVELDGTSSTAAQHSEEVRLPEWVPEHLPDLVLVFFPPGASAASVSFSAAAAASRYILSSQISASFLSPWTEMTLIGPGILSTL